MVLAVSDEVFCHRSKIEIFDRVFDRVIWFSLLAGVETYPLLVGLILIFASLFERFVAEDRNLNLVSGWLVVVTIRQRCYTLQQHDRCPNYIRIMIIFSTPADVYCIA